MIFVNTRQTHYLNRQRSDKFLEITRLNFTPNLNYRANYQMSQLDIQVEKAAANADVTVLSLKGDVDASTYKSLQDRAAEVIGEGAARIVLDLANVNYMGSAGFRAIHAIANMLNAEESEHTIKSEHLKLANATADVSKVIKTLGFDAYLDVFSSTDAAVASF